MMSFREQASCAKMMSPGGKQTALASHMTLKVNTSVELTYISTNFDKGLNYGIKHTDTQHNDTQPRANQHNDPQHNVKLSIAFLLLLVKPACSALV
jgi:hypothetical protein